MRNILFLFLIIFALGSCGDDQMVVDEELIIEYINDNGLTTQKTSSGLHYIIFEPGSEEKPTSLSTVTVSYTGMLLDGFVFDSTTATNSTAVFPLAATIEGWVEGIPLVGRGGKLKLLIPSHLAYGNSPPTNSIPKNAVLIFDIDLIDFEN